MRIIDVINEIITKGALAIPSLDAFLSGLAKKFPDTAGEIEEYRSELNSQTTPEGLLALGKTVFDELSHFKGLDPRQSPSNLAG